MASDEENGATNSSHLALGTTTFLQNRFLPLYTIGGGVILPLAVHLIFNWNDPDTYFLWIGIIATSIGILLHLVPPMVVLSPERIQVFYVGYRQLDMPWCGIMEIELFRASAPDTFGLVAKTSPYSPRNLGIRLRPDWVGKVRPKSGDHGYHATIPSMWDVPIARIAEEADRYWRAQGGTGGINDRIAQPAILANLTDQS